jgi:hypothetical protein
VPALWSLNVCPAVSPKCPQYICAHASELGGRIRKALMISKLLVIAQYISWEP